MGVYSEGLARYLNREDLSLRSRASESAGASGGTITGPWIEVGDRGSAYLEVVVYAAPSGTSPTMLVTVETSNDASNAVTAGKIGANGHSNANGSDPSTINAVGTYRGVFPVARYVRFKAVLGGTSTPTFDFSVGGNAA